MIQIIVNEWKMLLRVRVLAYLSLFFIAALTAITWLGVVQNQQQQEQQRAAQAHVREQWESIESMNPHSAGHYGSYAFKPLTSLSSLDDGINAITGNVLRLEGHVQNEMVYSEASQSIMISKFGKLKPSLLLQYVIPLFLIFLAFASVSSERETGRLKLLVLQGASPSKLILSKAFSVWLYGFLLLAFTLVIQVVANAGGTDADAFVRMGLFLLVYALYFYIVALMATWFSARLNSHAGALSSMLALWILWTIFLPKIWGNTADQLHPLPSRQEFKTAMQDDRSKGLDGHNPSDKRSEEFKQQVLAKYGVDSVQQLPVNFSGLRMQADEEYGNQVWDKHFGEQFGILQKQKQFFQLSGIVNPFASLQSIGMGLSATDMLHHVDFLRQAEDYRRHMIKTLNDQQAFGNSPDGMEDNAFYKSLKDFEYRTPQVSAVIGHYGIDFLLLAGWAFIMTIIVGLTGKHIKLI